MKYPENFADLVEELRLLKERITLLESGVFGSPQKRVHEFTDEHDAQITVQHQQGANIAIAIRSPSKASTQHPPHVDSGHQSAMFGNPGPLFPMLIRTASPPLFPMPIPTASTPRLIPSQTVSSCLSRSPINPAPPPTPIPPASPPAPIPSQSIGPSLSWGLMMTPGEVQELLASEPQVGEYYVITKGRRPGVYLTWSDAHALIDGLSSPCHWKKTDKFAAQGQYTLAYQKGNCEYRFQ